MKGAIATVFLRRSNDPEHEYRRMEVLKDEETGKFMLFESVFFASEPEAYQTALTKIDSLSSVMEAIWQEIMRLSNEDGFTIVSREGLAFLERINTIQ